MWQNILVWALVVGMGLICLRWVFKTLTKKQGEGCGCSSTTCPLQHGGECSSSSENSGG